MSQQGRYGLKKSENKHNVVQQAYFVFMTRQAGSSDICQKRSKYLMKINKHNPVLVE